MQAQDIMSSPVYIVSPAETLAHARNLMVKHHISRVVVMDEGRIAGILTKKDIAYRLRQAVPDWRRRPLDQIPIGMLMATGLIVITPDTGVREIAAIFMDRNISGVPVVENGALAGIVTKSDLMRSRLVSELGGRITDVMEDVATVNRFHSLVHVIDVMSERDDKVVVLNNDGSPAGIITETSIAFFDLGSLKVGRPPAKEVQVPRRVSRRGQRSYRYLLRTSVIAEDVMALPVITARPGEPLTEAIRLMREHGVSSVVVFDGTETRGIVKRDDIIKEVAK
jgi:CBS domain-containing protein